MGQSAGRTDSSSDEVGRRLHTIFPHLFPMTVRPQYNEAIESALVSIGKYRQTDREVKLRSDAAIAWWSLMSNSSAAGIAIIPISGFRTIAYQDSLFKKAVARH